MFIYFRFEGFLTGDAVFKGITRNIAEKKIEKVKLKKNIESLKGKSSVK